MTNGVNVRILGDDSDLQKKLSDSAVAIAKWGAAAASAAVAGALVLTKATAESSREIKNLSRLIGVNTTEFQKMAAGAKTVGIEQDKLADIFKDVSDKVGDFVQTGAGPLADFFDNIAPKVGVTADEFAKLSGPQALEKYVSSLEAANVSQNEMTFFMEAIASDASLLTPLLKNNAEGFKRLGAEAEESGAVLSEIEIEQLEQLNRTVDKAELGFQALANKTATTLAPQLVALYGEIDNLIDGAGGFDAAIEKAFDVAITGAGFLGNAMRGVDIIIDGTVLAFKGLEAASLAVSLSITEAIDGAVRGSVEKINGMIASLNEIPGVDISNIIVGESELVAGIKESAVNANSEFIQLQENLHKKLMEPLPSESLKKWTEEAKAASIEVANATIEARGMLVVPADEDPEILAAREKFTLLLAEQEAFELAKSGKIQEFNQAELSTAAEFSTAIVALEAQQTKNRLAVASDMFGNLSALMTTGNKNLFEIGKAAAISQSIINGYSAAIASYEKGAQIGGPVLGAAFAATSAIATGAQIASLSSTTFGSKSAGGAAPLGAPNIPDQGNSTQEPAQNRTVRIDGIDANQNFSGTQVQALAENLVELQNDGFKLVV